MKSGLEQTVGGPLSIFSAPPVTPVKAATITTGVLSQMFADLKKERRERSQRSRKKGILKEEAAVLSNLLSLRNMKTRSLAPWRSKMPVAGTRLFF